MQVQDLLNMPAFKNFTSIAGEKGVSRTVSTVSVMDAPDIYNWLKGGEFLLTTGYIMKDNPAQLKELIMNINKAGAAALGIKLTRFINELPEEVLEIAEQLNFPIISVPYTFSFTDIIDPVLSQIVNEQAQKLLFSQKIHESFTKLVIDGGGIEKILLTLESILDVNVSYYDSYFEKVYTSDAFPELEDIINTTKLHDLLSQFYCFPIKIDKTNYGYLILNEDPLHTSSFEYGQIAIEHASTVIKLHVQKKLSNIQIEEKYRDEFVQDLILNNINYLEEIQSRARLYGWDFAGDSVVLIVDIDNFKEKYLRLQTDIDNYTLEEIKNRIFLDARNKVGQYFSTPISTTFSDSIVFILKPQSKQFSEIKNTIRALGNQLRESILKNYQYSITVGIGQLKHSSNEIYISYSEAKKAIKLSRSMFKQNQTSFYDDLGVFKLFENTSPQLAKEYWTDYIGKLIEHDQLTKSQLVSTLESLVLNDWNLKAASDELFIHYNTMKYRFQKVCEILGKDFKQSEDKLNISIALKLYKISQ